MHTHICQYVLAQSNTNKKTKQKTQAKQDSAPHEVRQWQGKEYKAEIIIE
jgi:hypothetical protein